MPRYRGIRIVIGCMQTNIKEIEIMKGLYFKQMKQVYEIISDPLTSRNSEGTDDIVVVVKRLSDNWVNIEEVINIPSVEKLYEHC